MHVVRSEILYIVGKTGSWGPMWFISVMVAVKSKRHLGDNVKGFFKYK